VDEYQDLSPLQDALIRQWIEQADRVYVAGDPDQSIYGFRGGRPDLFKSLPAEDRGSPGRWHPADLPAVRYADHGRGRTDLRPTGERGPLTPGRAVHAGSLHAQPEALPARIEDALKAYAGGPVFVLSRFRKHVSKIARTLAAMGSRAPGSGPVPAARGDRSGSVGTRTPSNGDGELMAAHPGGTPIRGRRRYRPDAL